MVPSIASYFINSPPTWGQGIRQEIFQIEKEYGRVIVKLFDNSSAVLKEAFKEQLLNLLPAQKNKIETTFGSPYIAPDHLQLLFQMSTMANEAGRRRHLRLNSDIESVDFGVLDDQRLKREYGSLFFLFGLDKELELTADQVTEVRANVNEWIKQGKPIHREMLQNILLEHQIARLDQIHNQSALGFDASEFTFGLIGAKEYLALSDTQIKAIQKTAESQRKKFYDDFWKEIQVFKEMRQRHLEKQLGHLSLEQRSVFKEIFGTAVLSPVSIPFNRLPSVYLRTVDFRPPPAFDLSEN